MRYRYPFLLFVVSTGVIFFALSRLPAADDQPTTEQVFQKRFVPIFQSPDPSSCTQCHLSSVDLKNYILPSSAKPFLSLRDQGLIDLQKPDDSEILRLIAVSETDKGGANLVHEKTRKAEFEAFAEWIKACCNDPKLRDDPKLDAKDFARPDAPNEVIRHGRKDHLLESFEQNVWAMRFRCMSCHIEGTAENDKLAKKRWRKGGGGKGSDPLI